MCGEQAAWLLTNATVDTGSRAACEESQKRSPRSSRQLQCRRNGRPGQAPDAAPVGKSSHQIRATRDLGQETVAGGVGVTLQASRSSIPPAHNGQAPTGSGASRQSCFSVATSTSSAPSSDPQRAGCGEDASQDLAANPRTRRRAALAARNSGLAGKRGTDPRSKFAGPGAARPAFEITRYFPPIVVGDRRADVTLGPAGGESQGRDRC